MTFATGASMPQRRDRLSMRSSDIPPVGVARFALFAAAGASALAVIFGAAHWVSFDPDCVERRHRRVPASLVGRSEPQPLRSTLLRSAARGYHRSGGRPTSSSVPRCASLRYVPVWCWSRARIFSMARSISSAGDSRWAASRIGYARLIILMICTGLLVGLVARRRELAGLWRHHPGCRSATMSLPRVSLSRLMHFLCHAVAHCCRFPILIGVLAHACRWAVISIGGGSAETGALVACLVVGIARHADRRPIAAALSRRSASPRWYR